MGRITIHDGPTKRPIPVDTYDGVIEIDLSGSPTVTVPEDVKVVDASGG